MRITSGKYKGRHIQMPKGIRPTQGKVRKALFDILGDIAGQSFLELFAGSGAVGFEALSRNVAELTLVEYNRNCQLAIKKNIESLRTRACNLYPLKTEMAIRLLHQNKQKFDIIFMDPPYHEEGLLKKILQSLGAYDILAPNGFIVAQHCKKDTLPNNLGDLKLFKQSRYGDTVLSFYRKVNPKSQ